LTCMKFNSAAWELVGDETFTAIDAYCFGIDFLNGTPYLAFTDYSKLYRISCMKFNGTTWEYVGPQGIEDEIPSGGTFAIYNGSPNVVYTSDDYKACCKKYNGTSWEDVGSSMGFSKGEADYLSFCVYNGTPYVAYQDYYNMLGLTVQKFTNAGSTGWEVVGTEAFSPQTTFSTGINVDETTGTPYVVFVDNNPYGEPLSCMKFNGTSWEVVGEPGFTSGTAYHDSIAFVMQGGVPYAAYMDNDYGNKASVKKYDYRP
jgi:hypothetical protein